MKQLLRFFLPGLVAGFLALGTTSAPAQSLYFPPNVGNTWDTIQPSSLGWCQPVIDSLYDYLETNNSKAFILLKDGKIVLERYFGTFVQDSLWYWASAGKTLTAFTVGIAQQEGHLSIHDTTSDYLGTGWTACPPLKEEKITIRNQLTMTSGLDDGVPDVYCTLDTCLQYLADAGTRWAYHNGPYTLLDSVLEVATGMSLNAYLTQKVKTPTGMTGLFVPSGYNNVFYSKPRSMARFGLLLLNRGNWNGQQLLSDTAYFHDMTHSSQALNPGYGYLTWLNGQSSFLLPYSQFPFPGSIIPAGPNDMYAAIGKNGQLINVVPSQNLVFVRMGNAPDNSDVSMFLNDTIWQYINRFACGATGVDVGSQINMFRISPQPAHPGGEVRVEYQLAAASAASVVLRDLQGRVCATYPLGVPSVGAGTAVLRLPEELSRGMYLLQMETEQGLAAVRLVVD